MVSVQTRDVLPILDSVKYKKSVRKSMAVGGVTRSRPKVGDERRYQFPHLNERKAVESRMKYRELQSRCHWIKTAGIVPAMRSIGLKAKSIDELGYGRKRRVPNLDNLSAVSHN